MSATLVGLGVSPGVATGPVARLGSPPTVPADEVAAADPVAEMARVVAALNTVAEDLQRRATLASGVAVEVLGATAMMALDPGLSGSVETMLKGGSPTVTATNKAFEGFIAMLESAGGYLGERAADLRDVRDRTLAVLLDLPMPGLPDPGHPYVLLATDLAPADTALLDPAQVLGLVTFEGGPTSHTAILAKGLGLPAVVRCGDARSLKEGEMVVVDGSTGTVIVAPDLEQLASAAQRAADRTALAKSSSGPGRTADGAEVALLVNIGTVTDAEQAGAVDSEGVGLFRTEFLFLGREHAPDEDEQTTSYERVFRAFEGRRVVVRTLDAGADKPLPFVGMPPEENPALGVRGLRVARRRPDLLATQLAALGRAAASTGADVRVMAPMVSTVEEASAFAAQVREAGLPKAGVMIEVPAAALRARHVLAAVDFVSLGTNDLSQYTFAADRLEGELADLLDPWQPALLDLVATVGSAGADLGRSVGVCGESASDALLACVLVGLGVTSLSMATSALPAVRWVLSRHTHAQCIQMGEAARSAVNAADARAAVRGLATADTLSRI